MELRGVDLNIFSRSPADKEQHGYARWEPKDLSTDAGAGWDEI